MKVYVLTKTVTSELGGTSEKKPKVFTTRIEARKSILEDLKDEEKIFKNHLEELIRSEVNGFYWYKYDSKILGYTKIEYNIWESEL